MGRKAYAPDRPDANPTGLEDGELRVSNLQTGSFSGPLGPLRGQDATGPTWRSAALSLHDGFTVAAQQADFPRVIVPLRQAGEAKLVKGIDVFGIASITQLVAFLRDQPRPLVDPIEVAGDPAGKHTKLRLDLADVAGRIRRRCPSRAGTAGSGRSSTPDKPAAGSSSMGRARARGRSRRDLRCRRIWAGMILVAGGDR